ncbi:deoxyribonuclease NucA/NucB [Thermomonospora umbrina]|uniref:Deoxyribonuclease NucA/NucB n=2 Tax=Thermomonospora umbrina TaxID=111806 RepID=A0A3D9SVQ1_9ACTN|nr:deoxyribonuclease NucA/NucB [Thermomonospora umbrina]
MQIQHRRLSVLVLGVMGVLMSSLAIGTSSAAVPAEGGSRIEVTTVPAKLVAAGPGATAAAPCNVAYRTTACGASRYTIRVYNRNGVQTGQLNGMIFQKIYLNIKSRAFHETISVRADSIIGNATGISLRISASCGSGCKARVSGIGDEYLRPGVTDHGRIDYADSVKLGRIHQSRIKYTITALKNYYAPIPATWRLPIDFRCDDRLRKRDKNGRLVGQRPGCVFPAVPGHITSMVKLKFIAPNIRRWQRAGAPQLLHRNSFLTAGHRKAVCGSAKLPRGWTAPAGWPKPLSDRLNKPSCDEYAFAATVEGGAKPGNGYGWVPLRENNSQGHMLANSFNAQRVLNAGSAKGRGDAFYVFV